ncbi:MULTISPECIES: hypothetical protein [Ensifer]|uniref:hypothetical protein n=1 Tax=Ensifer TaxID=106591 RepID=UPI001FF063CC|nr:MULTISPECIES: hypothetical protein [Rhizobiaceae]MDF1632847.1 hypothetical protein [Mycoplana sp. MJR14]
MAIKFGTAIIVVTHDEKIIPTLRRIYHIRDGSPTKKQAKGAASTQARENDYLAAATVAVFADRKLTTIPADRQ